MKQTLKKGMTLVEILLVVTIVALLLALLIPVVKKSIEGKENALCASHLRRAVAAFELYRSEMGSYPADKYPGQIPPEMSGYFQELNIYDTTDDDHEDEWWVKPTELGGYWDWDNGYNFKCSVSISNPSKTEQMTDFDRLVDDGNLSTGKFRKVGTQYHYILEQ